ncbi:MAG: hypothetical protein J5I81_03790 [Nitrococcus mobilis]|nr:hypothetical protein [Nitrococcus mobilis]
MSLMTDIQGTPARVWSLVSLLRAHGGELSREGVKGWLDPFDTDTKGTAISNTIRAAASLELIQSDSTSYSLQLRSDKMPETLMGFADRVHTKLVETPADQGNSVILEVYAWFVANCAREKGTTWVERESADSLTEKIRVAITPEGQPGRFNSTRYTRWRDWIAFTGLGVDLPIPRGQSFYPSATVRLDRELEALRHRFGIGEQVPADMFLDALVQRMPYLDGGHLFLEAAGRIGWSPPARQLSIVFSSALRELDDEGVLELKMLGDAPNAFALHHDPTHRKQAFVSVVLNPGEAKNG